MESGLGAANDEVLTLEEPSIVFQRQGHPAREPSPVSIRSQFNGWPAATLSASGTCFFVRITETQQIERGTITNDFCTGAAAFTATSHGWQAIAEASFADIAVDRSQRSANGRR